MRSSSSWQPNIELGLPRSRLFAVRDVSVLDISSTRVTLIRDINQNFTSDSRVEDINDRRRLPHRASSSGRCNAIDYCTQCQTAVDLINLGILGRSEAVSDEECETPCTYTECILSVFLSGIPSVYVTGGYTEQRWTSSLAYIPKAYLRAIKYRILRI